MANISRVTLYVEHRWMERAAGLARSYLMRDMLEYGPKLRERDAILIAIGEAAVTFSVWGDGKHVRVRQLPAPP